MKRLFGAVLALVMLLALTGCGKEEYDVPANGMYHEKTGILLLLGMTEEEVDQQLEKYGKEDQDEELAGHIHYNLDDIDVGFSDGELFIMYSQSKEWKITGGIYAGSTLNDIRKAYGNPDDSFVNSTEEGILVWRYIISSIDISLAYRENEDRVFEVSIADLSKFG